MASSISGESDFQAIFIPWYWQTEYTAHPREMESVSMSDEEEELLSIHQEDGLTKEHLYWREKKVERIL